LLGYAAQYWYFSAKTKDHQGYFNTFDRYLFAIVMPVLISFLSILLCPNHDEKGFQNLGVHFEANAGLIYFIIGASLWAAAFEPWVAGRPEDLSYPSENTVRLLNGTVFALFWLFPTKINVLGYFALSRDFTFSFFAVAFGIFRLAMNKRPI